MPGGVLITGGAGYIGSCFAWACKDAGLPFAIIDDLSTGDPAAPPPGAPFAIAKASNHEAVEALVRGHGLDTIVHFAGSTSVEESVRNPELHERNNLEETRALVQSAVTLGLGQFVMCSTAAVYGEVSVSRVSERTPARPLNPYGRTKLAAEQLLIDALKLGGPRFVALRPFNVAGADPHMRAGQRAAGSGNLILTCCDAALGLRDVVIIHGDAYPTPDGTCIRDFIHVADLADAHLSAVTHLSGGGESLVLNCGTGRGYSVREVIAAFNDVLGRSLPIEFGPRRAGDPAQVVADARKIGKVLDWRPRRADLRQMVQSALAWRESFVAA